MVIFGQFMFSFQVSVFVSREYKLSNQAIQ